MSDFREAIVRRIRSFSVAHRIEINGWCLSVQAGEGHYCSPRKTLDSIYNYDSFEIALWVKQNGKDGRFLNIDMLFPGLELDQRDKVVGYVPVEKVQELYNLLQEVAPPPNVNDYVYVSPYYQQLLEEDK